MLLLYFHVRRTVNFWLPALVYICTLIGGAVLRKQPIGITLDQFVRTTACEPGEDDATLRASIKDRAESGEKMNISPPTPRATPL